MLSDSMQEAMPYEELDKLVNEKLLDQYIESRCPLKMITWIYQCLTILDAFTCNSHCAIQRS